MLRGCLTAIGVLALGVVILLAVGIPTLIKASRGSGEMVEQSWAAMTADGWDVSILREKGTPALRARMTDTAITQLETFADTNLGAFEAWVEPLRCPSISTGTSTGVGSYTIAECNGLGQFQKANARVRMTLSKEDDVWLIQDFALNLVFAGSDDA